MRFVTTGSMFFKQGTEKAHAVHGAYGRTYYIPRKLVKVIETIPAENEYDIEHHVVEIPDWIIRKNSIPVFNLDELVLDR